MKSYNDFVAAPNKEKFIADAINEFIGSEAFRTAISARLYGKQQNEAILGRFISFVSARQETRKNAAGLEESVTIPFAQKSITRANNQIANGMFGKIIQQKVQYTIGNGIVIDEEIKAELPKHTDRSVQRAGLNASYFGIAWAYVFINSGGEFDFQIFKGEEFIPLRDELTDEVKVGIRFFEVPDKDYKIVEVFEVDGLTTYKMNGGKPFEVINPKTAYKIKLIQYPSGERVISAAVNPYGMLPIIPFYNNEERTSDFRVGTKKQLDLFDIIMSDFGNNLEDNNDVYWVLKNYDGQDVAQFKAELDAYKAIKVGGEGSAEPHTSEVPYQARQTALEILRKQIYSDQMALDIESIRGGSLTNVAIKVAQSDLDLKCSEFEWGALDFVEQLLGFWKVYAGYSDDIEVGDFIRRTFINDTEIIQNLAQTTDLSEQTRVERHPYAAKDELKRKEEEQAARYTIDEIDDEPIDDTALYDTANPDEGVAHNPETRAEAEKRAERLNFPKSNIICLEGDNWCYIAPHGITSAAAKKAYAEARRKGESKETAAKIAHSVQNK